MTDIQLYNGFGIANIGNSAYIQPVENDNFDVNSIEIKSVPDKSINVINPFCCIDYNEDIDQDRIYVGDALCDVNNTKTKTPWFDYNNPVNAKNLASRKSSYSLLRANPKLTGNVKVVIDSKDDIYLDTFKVNDTLSKKKYRHVPINHNDYYGENVMSVFRNVPSDVLYYVPNEYKTIFTTTNKLNSQYIDTYRSGASINTDKLYSENFSILSPLCIHDTLPDFFLIFRVNDIVDIDSADGTPTMEYLLKNGNIIKTFDLRKETAVGKYIQTIRERSKNIVAPIYVTQNTDNLNMYTGISVSKGVVSKFYESAVSDKSTNQTAMNNHYTNAFERNQIVSANTVNFEFMFDDNDSEQFSINTYFGLYVTTNETIDDFYCTGKDEFSGEYIFNINKEDHTIFNIEHDDDMLYCYNSNDDCRRITTENKNNVIDDYVLKTGENILSTTAKNIQKINNFITLNLNDTLQPGEHLKVLCKYVGNQPLDNNDRVYEVIMSSDKIYKKYDKNVSRYIENVYEFNDKKIDIKRCSVFTEYRDNVVDKNEKIKEQIDSIEKAFNIFSDGTLVALNKTNNSISIVSSNDDYEYTLQRITNSITPSKDSLYKILEDGTDSDVVTYFGNYKVGGVIIDTTSDESLIYTEENIIYNIHNFEILGPRISYIVNFIRLDDENNTYKVYEINPNFTTTDVIYRDLLYKDDDTNKTTGIFYDKFNITSKDSSFNDVTTSVNIIQSYKNLKSQLCRVRETSNISKLNLYEPYMINIGICGILSVKDYNFYVLDSSNYINQEDPPVIIHDGNVSIESIRHYIKYDDVDTEIGPLNDYITMLYNNGITNSSVSLTSPHCCKWVSPSTVMEDNYYALYYDPGANLRLMKGTIGDVTMEDSSILNHVADNYGNNVRYGILNGTETTTNITNVFGKKEIKCYSIDKNTIEFIISGVKFRLSTTNSNIINMYDLNNYTISFVKDAPSGNQNPMEMYIDNENKTILLVYYDMFTNNVIDPEHKYSEISIPIKSNDLYTNDYGLLEISVNSIGVDNVDKIISAFVINDGYTIYGNIDSSTTHNKIVLKDTSCYYYKKTDINRDIQYYTTEVTNELLDDIANNYSGLQLYIITTEDMINHIEVSTDYLKTFENIGVYVSDGSIYKNYSNTKDIMKIDIVLPTNMKMPNVNDGSVYQTYYEPDTNDIFVFKEYDTSVYKNSKYANIKLEKVNTLEQLWLNKYTTDTNYCFAADSSGYNAMSIDMIKNYNIMTSPWNDKFFKKYTRTETNRFESAYEPGYKNIPNIKTFFNSNAMIIKNKNNNSIQITNWTKTTGNKNRNMISFNISESLINKIYTSKTFNDTWYKLGLNDNTDKINYIKNNIMNIININTTNKLNVYFYEDGVNGFVNTLSDTDKTKYKLVTNIKNELIFSNGSYYMHIYMNNTTKGKYHIEYNINV